MSESWFQPIILKKRAEWKGLISVEECVNMELIAKLFTEQHRKATKSSEQKSVQDWKRRKGQE